MRNKFEIREEMFLGINLRLCLYFSASQLPTNSDPTMGRR